MIDLRSDTVTRPTRAMRRVMAEAAVGDDVFGEDPTTNRLEEYVAALLGKEAALYCPSGTMTNQIGVYLATGRGDEVILHEDAYIFNYEVGASALLSGVQVRPIIGEGGVVSPETLRTAVRPENVHFPRPKLLLPGEHPQRRRRQGRTTRGVQNGRRRSQGARPQGTPRWGATLQRASLDRHPRP